MEKEKEKLQTIEVANFVNEFSLPSTQRYAPTSNYTSISQPTTNPGKPTLGDFLRNRGKAPISTANNSPSTVQNTQLPQTSQQQFPMAYQPQQTFSPIQQIPQNNYQFAPVSQHHIVPQNNYQFAPISQQQTISQQSHQIPSTISQTIPQNNYQFAPINQQQTISQQSHQIPSTSQPIYSGYQAPPMPAVSQPFMPSVQSYSMSQQTPFNGQQQFYSQSSMPVSQPSVFVQPNPISNAQATYQNGHSNGFTQQPVASTPSQSAQSILEDFLFGGPSASNESAMTNTNVIQPTSNSAFVPTQQNVSYNQPTKPTGVSPWHTSSINPLLMNRKP